MSSACNLPSRHFQGRGRSDLADEHLDHQTVRALSTVGLSTAAADSKVSRGSSRSTNADVAAAARVAELLTDAGSDAEDNAAPECAVGLGASVLVSREGVVGPNESGMHARQ